MRGICNPVGVSRAVARMSALFDYSFSVSSLVKYTVGKGETRWRVRYRDISNKSASKGGFTTEKAAKKFAADLTLAKATGTELDRGSQKQLAGVYIEQHINRTVGLSLTTIANRKSVGKNHVLPVWGRVPLERITRKGVRDWVETMHQAGHGAGIIQKSHGILLASFALAMDDRAIGMNPASGVKVPRAIESANTYLTHAEVIELADAVDPRSRTLVGLLAYTGLRFGELSALRVGKVNLETRRLTIDRSLTTVDGVLVESQPKFKKNREVFFPEIIRSALEEQMEGKRKTDFVFSAPRGGPVRLDDWRPRTFNKALKDINAAREAAAVAKGRLFDDFPDITPHDLRHTAASIAVSSGANVKVLQKMLGHASASMTLDRYADLFDSDDVSVANAINVQIVDRVGAGTWSVSPE
tara:strand:- start:29090 stop:30328 length:1239 start_codon:yes stop_codon:yes gene_type:complete